MNLVGWKIGHRNKNEASNPFSFLNMVILSNLGRVGYMTKNFRRMFQMLSWDIKIRNRAKKNFLGTP